MKMKVVVTVVIHIYFGSESCDRTSNSDTPLFIHAIVVHYHHEEALLLLLLLFLLLSPPPFQP